MTSPAPMDVLAAFDWSRLGLGLGLVLFGFVCVLLVLAILIQKPQGGGLSGAFGAGGSSGSGQTAFGTKTGDALTWMTVGIFVAYLGASIGMNYAMRPAKVVVQTPAADAGKPAPVTPPSGGAPAGGAPTGAGQPGAGVAAPAIPGEGERVTTPPVESTINVKPPVAPVGTPPTTSPAPSTPPPGPGTSPTPAPAPVAPAPVAPAPVAPR